MQAHFRSMPLTFTLSAALLAMLSACDSSEPANHAQYGGMWEQAFSQALVDNPGKGGGGE